MKMRVSRWGLLALLVPLGLLALVLAQEGERPAAPPAEPPIADEPKQEEAEELLPPGERLSADNNLSWPVDI